jgi:peroxiredoxin
MEALEGLKPGGHAVDFTLPGVDGKTYSLGGFKDKPILVLSWICVHCPYVQASEDRFLALAREFAPRGVQFVGINSNDARAYPEDSFENMKARAKQKGYPFPYLRDEDQKVAEVYGPIATPEFYVFDRNRQLVYRGQMDDSHRDPRRVKRQTLRQVLEALTAGKQPPLNFATTMGCSIKWAG